LVHAGDALPALAVEVTARTVVLGASASRDWQPQHHDHAWATERAGTKDIFLNTPAQAGWIERYLTDWTGPRGRLGRMRFRMRRSVVPGDLLEFSGMVNDVAADEAGCWWASVAVTMRVGEERVTEATARVALPADENDNPWARAGDAWRP
jgi:hypothetical protein